MIIIDVTNHASENENNFHHILNSQFKGQESLSSIDTNFNDTIDENNNASNDLTSSDEAHHFKSLTFI